MIGQTISHYKILEKLGGGGMGVVYKAEDTKLKRFVALKFLPPELTRDDEAKERFVHEAQTASALDHPNICVIHEIDETEEGQIFICMAYYEGETLKKRIAKGEERREKGEERAAPIVPGSSPFVMAGGLSVDGALDIAMQIAQGLARAHEAGITHRDIKPANIMVTNRGEVKIVDFGLAKLAGQTRLTKSGMTVGTVAYMSPEQARGEEVDQRTDIWSLGVVLYELITGQLPFRGEYEQAVVYSILSEDPKPMQALRSEVPMELEQIVNKTLAKKPEERYQNIEEMLGDLSRLKAALKSGKTEPLAVLPWHKLPPRTYLHVGAAVFFVSLIAVGLYLFLGRLPAERRKPQPTPRVVPLTAYWGNESDPALSPDGRQLAFVWDGGEPNSTSELYVKIVGEDRATKLTEGTQNVATPAWSPDGRRIAFLRPSRKPGTQVTAYDISVVPSQGGRVLKLGSAEMFDWPSLSWSPDSKLLAIMDRISPESSPLSLAIVLFSLETGEKRPLSRPPAQDIVDYRPRFSPDGKTLAFIRYYKLARSELVVQSVHDSAARVIAQPNGFVDDADWTRDGKALITNIYEKETGTFRLWRIPVNGGESESLGFGEAASGGVSTARQGPGLAFMRDNTDCNIWRIPGPASREGGATRLIASTRMDFFPRYSPDGRHIAFLSDRTGPERLWVCDAEGQNCSELPTRTRPFSPNWAPDGKQMVYVERDLGNRDIYVTSLNEAFPRPLVEWKSRDGFPAWSPDGRWIYFASDSTGRNEIWKVPAHGGKPEQVTRQGGTHTEVSEDGRFILYNRAREWNLLKVPVEGGDEVLVLEKYFRMQDSFKPWRNNVIFIDWSKRPYVLYLLDLNTGETTEITPLDDKDLCNGLSISPDGRWILYVNNEGTGVDIMFVENFP